MAESIKAPQLLMPGKGGYLSAAQLAYIDSVNAATLESDLGDLAHDQSRFQVTVFDWHGRLVARTPGSAGDTALIVKALQEAENPDSSSSDEVGQACKEFGYLLLSVPDSSARSERGYVAWVGLEDEAGSPYASLGTQDNRGLEGGNGPLNLRFYSLGNRIVAISLRNSEDIAIASQDLFRQDRRHLRLSYHDNMTGLRNKEGFRDEAARLLQRAQRYGTSFVLGMVDGDDFKSINDTYGHMAGDAVICAMANVIGSGYNRGSDVVGRFGGDEFCFALELRDDEKIYAALEYAANLQRKIAAMEVVYEGKKIPCVASMGIVALLPQTETGVIKAINRDHLSILRTAGKLSHLNGPVSLTQLIQRADQELYAAKSARGYSRLGTSRLACCSYDSHAFMPSPYRGTARPNGVQVQIMGYGT